MAYKPYPIYDFRQGMVTAVKPWLSPKDAFEELNNCFLRRGVLEKRRGYTEFAEMVHTHTGTGADTNPGNTVMGIYNYYSGTSEILLTMDTERVNRYNTVTSALVDVTTKKIRFKTGGNGGWSATEGVKGATSGATATVAAVDIDSGAFASSNANGTLHISGQTGTFAIGENLEKTGDPGVTRGVNNQGGDSSDCEFTGDDSQFFWVENWKDYAYITNNNDQMQRYNANNRVTQFNIDLDVEGGPDNDVNSCLLIFTIQSRLVMFRVTERGSAHYQRARWCEVNAPTIWKDANYIDAPTEDWITSADFIGPDLIVWFERSVWRFSYTGDPDQPFRWDKVADTEGCYATMSVVSYSDELVCVGPTRMVGTDGRDVYGMDDRIPDFLLGTNQDLIGYCYGLIVEEMGQAMISYGSLSASKPDSALVLNYDDNCWSTYTLPIHVMGYSAVEGDITWADMTEDWDDVDWAWNDKELQAGYPTTLMGCRDGKIYRLNDGGADDGEDIPFNAKSGSWNPHHEENRKAQLGKVGFLVDKNALASFDVEFFLDSEGTAYQTKNVVCDETGVDTDMVWKWVYSGAIGGFHSINIKNEGSSNRPVIHAIIPFFQRGGRLIG